MSNPEKCVVFIQKFRRERELENRIEALKDLILKYAIDENWDIVKLFVKDLRKSWDELNYLN